MLVLFQDVNYSIDSCITHVCTLKRKTLRIYNGTLGILKATKMFLDLSVSFISRDSIY